MKRCLPWERRRSSGPALWKLAVTVAVGAILVHELPNLIRYVKIERM